MNPTNADNLRVDKTSLGEDEALLLHVAGELPADAARVMDLRLASDAALQARFDSLRDLDNSLADFLGEVSLSGEERTASDSAQRRIGAMMNKAIVERAIGPAKVRPAAFRWRINKWVAGGIAAAAAIVGVAVWIATSDLSGLHPQNEMATDDGASDQPGETADVAPDQDEGLADAFPAEPTRQNPDDGALAPAVRIDRNLQALQLVDWSLADETASNN